MATLKARPFSTSAIWALAEAQHGVISRPQLLAVGLTPAAVRHRLGTGRLHRLYAGVYAVGRPDVARLGELMAAVLASGEDAEVSHSSGGELLRLRPRVLGPIEISVPAARGPANPGIRLHRTTVLRASDRIRHHGIPVTSPARTLVGLAAALSRHDLERAVNEADVLDLIDPETLRRELEHQRGRPGVARLRALLDRDAFRLTDSVLEQRFLPIAAAAGLSPPETRRLVDGYRVDFFWPELGLVVETDGLRYHRTASRQERDIRREHAHRVAGREPLRFTHAQIAFEQRYVRDVLAEVAARLRAEGSRLPVSGARRVG